MSERIQMDFIKKINKLEQQIIELQRQIRNVDTGTSTTTTIVSSNNDPNAIHDNVANEISILTNVAPASGDHILLEDADNSNSKKKTTFADIEDYIESAGLDYIDLTENASPGTPPVNVGRLYAEDVTGFTTFDYLWSDGVTSYDLDLLRDTIAIVRNNTGGTLVKGTVVNAIGSTGNFATVNKLDATSNDEDDDVLGLVFEDINDSSFGIVLTSGDLENYDTSMFNAGDFLFVDPATPGGLTSTRPSARDREYPVGEVIKSNVAGSILVKPKRYIDNDFRSLHYSTFLEQHKITISSNGTVITATLDNFQGDSYLQAFFSNGKTIITPTLTVDTNGTLTAGTDTVPQVNYIYILASAPSTLVASTSGWPTAEHIRCAIVNLLSAATTQSDGGAFTNQIWNDEPSFEGANPRGHIAHIGEVIRNRGSLWNSGVAGAGSTSGYITITDPGGGDEVYFETGSGKVFQFHEQSWGVFDSATDDMFVKNDNTTAYKRINDMRADITADSTGTTITNNRYFNLIFFGVVNEGAANNWVGINLPAGFYTSANAARVDREKYDDYSIPDQFKTVAFLICRITFQLQSTTWVVQATDDLRGNRPSIAQGAFGSAQKNEFLDSNFRIQDDSDPTKQIAFQASGITTATTRTITVPDKNFTVAGTDDLYTDSDVESYLESQGFDPSAMSFSTSIDMDGTSIFLDFGTPYIGWRYSTGNQSVFHKIRKPNDGAGALVFDVNYSSNTADSQVSFWDNNGSVIMDVLNGSALDMFMDIDLNSNDLLNINNLDHDGNAGFFGTAPVAQSAAYSITNVTTDRTYDANSTTLAEIADALGTLIADLQNMGLIG